MLKHRVEVVLRSPYVDFEWQAFCQSRGCFQLHHQLHVIRIFEQLLRHSLYRLPERKRQDRTIELDIECSALIKEGIDPGEIEIFRIFECIAEVAVQREGRGSL